MPVRPLHLLPLLCAAIAALALALSAGAARAAIPLPGGFEDVTLASGITGTGANQGATDVAWAPDGRMFVAERSGFVYVYNPGQAPGTHTVLLNISGHVNTPSGANYGDQGLLGIAVDSDFATNHYLWLLYTYDQNGNDSSNVAVSTLSRVTVNANNTVVGGQTTPTETFVLGTVRPTSPTGKCITPPPNDHYDCMPSEGTSHSIGTVISAPDGTLYAGTGDAAFFCCGQTPDTGAFQATNPTSMRGKIFHIDRNGNGVTGHPFCPGETDLTGVCTKVFAEGMRNPFRFNLRPSGGLAIGDVGQANWEELDLTGAGGGENFGWPCWEGTVSEPDFGGTQACAGVTPGTPPALAYPHDYSNCNVSAPSGNTVIGGPIYNGDQYPAGYRGQLFIGDWDCDWIIRGDVSGNSITNLKTFTDAMTHHQDVALRAAPNGDLVYVALSGEVHEIVYGPGNHAPIVSAAGTPTSGNAPLSVNFKATASDPDGDALHYDWDFGDGSPHSTAPNPTHVYMSTGNRTARVTVDDGRGMSASAPVSMGVTASVTRTPLPILRLRLSRSIARLAARGILSGSFTSSHSVRTVDVSLWRGKPVASASCRWWSRRSHRLRSGDCSQPHWMKATLHRKRTAYTWKVNLRGVPSAGRYTLILQAIPRDASLGPSERLHRSLRVPRRSHTR